MPGVPGYAGNFAQLLIDSSPFPHTSVNYLAIGEWVVSETSAANMRYNNPLNSIDASPIPMGNIPGTYIPVYPDMIYAAQHYIAKFRTDKYQDIYKALAKGTSLYAIWKAIHNSPWCSGCGATYPTPLYNVIGGVPETHPQKPEGKTPGPAFTPATGPTPVTRDMRKHWDELMRQIHVYWPRELKKAQHTRSVLKRSLYPHPDRTGGGAP